MTVMTAPPKVVLAARETDTWQSHTVDLGTPVHYADFGGHGPLMVLVHGIASSHLNWMGVGPVLARRHRVVAVDLPGYGLSRLGEDPASVQNSQKYLDRFIDHVAGGERVVLWGHSMGGLVSILQTAAHPEKVRRLLLLAPAAPFPRRAVIGPMAFPFLFAMLAPRRSAAVLKRGGARLEPEKLVRQALKRISAPTSTIPEDIILAHIDLLNMQREQHDWTERALIESAASLVKTTTRRRQYRRVIQDIHVPVLLMHGTRDRLVPYAAGTWLHRQRPDWSWRPLRGLGHMAQMEDADLVLDTIAEWELAQRYLEPAA